MEFLQNNWFWIVVLAFFVWMSASGRGCCGPRNHDSGHGEEDQTRQ